MRLLASLVLLALMVLPASAIPARQRGDYVPAGQCDGLPRIALKTLPGLCVGLVASGLKFPRGLALIGSDVYVAELGARTPGRGRILKFAQFGRAAPVVILSGLNQPSGLAAGRDGKLYVGEIGRIFRFDPKAPDPRATITAVVNGLPNDGRHQLSAFILTPDGGLIVNVGSFSDNCEAENGRAPNPAARCPEQLKRPPRGSLLRIGPTAQLPVLAANAEIFAIGIRNAMALVWLPNGSLLAASNGRDNIDSANPRLSDEALPHDVLLTIEKGGNYGWPHCFDMGRPAPEYPRFDCRTVRSPTMLLPPHAAPLGMIFYASERLPRLTGKLLLAYHGYRALGHRIVAIAPGTRTESEIVSGWTRVAGQHPQGTPVALLELPDGSVLISEDHNGTLLRLAAVR